MPIFKHFPLLKSVTVENLSKPSRLTAMIRCQNFHGLTCKQCFCYGYGGAEECIFWDRVTNEAILLQVYPELLQDLIKLNIKKGGNHED
ncbi:MAG: hypothetical protein KAS32_25290 [Candidatus Peribacteraceae bacterium]|nr:hypothetical protein [Candidatus Peribacteraceae bacterium]